MDEFINTLNFNCENSNKGQWRSWTESRFRSGEKLYCCAFQSGKTLCLNCEINVIKKIYSSFETNLCQACHSNFSSNVLNEVGYVLGEKMLECLKQKSWICDQCTTNIKCDLNTYNTNELEHRIDKLENMLAKICNHMGISTEE